MPAATSKSHGDHRLGRGSCLRTNNQVIKSAARRWKISPPTHLATG